MILSTIFCLISITSISLSFSKTNCYVFAVDITGILDSMYDLYAIMIGIVVYSRSSMVMYDHLPTPSLSSLEFMILKLVGTMIVLFQK